MSGFFLRGGASPPVRRFGGTTAGPPNISAFFAANSSSVTTLASRRAPGLARARPGARLDAGVPKYADGHRRAHGTTAVQMAGIRFELDDPQVPANIAQNVGLRNLPHTHLVSR